MTLNPLFDLFPATRGRMSPHVDDPVARRLRFELMVMVMTGLSVPVTAGEAVALHGGRSWTVAAAMPVWLAAYAALGTLLLGRRPLLMLDNRLIGLFYCASAAVVLAIVWNFGGPQDPVWLGYIIMVVLACSRWQLAGVVISLIPFYFGRVLTNVSYSWPSQTSRTQEVTLELIVMTAVAVVIGFLFRELESSRARLRESAAALVESHAALEASTTRLSTVLEHVAEAIVTIDEHDLLTSANRAAGDLFACTPADLIGQTVAVVLSTNQLVIEEPGEAMTLREGPTAHRQATGRRPDGREFAFDLQTTMVPGEHGPIRIVVIRDVTDERAHTAALTYQALHDALTGLPNRQQFQDRLNARVAAALGSGDSFSVFLMDMDGFKDVNDALGHLAGDRLLQEVARRLRHTLRNGDLVARLGGDEFAVLPSGNASPAVAGKIAHNILAALKEPYAIDGHVTETGMSIGIAHYPEHGIDSETLLRRADLAMYAAKRARRGWVTYMPTHDQSADYEHRYHLSELRRALENDELLVHYLPAIRLRDGALVGVEALIQWQHPAGGLITPDQFIPMAEQSEVIKPLTRFVIDAALRQQHEWREAGHVIPVSVNLSGRNVHDYQLPATIKSLMHRWGATPTSLTLEIAENATLSAGAIEALQRLADCGVALAIDDYGAGHASLLHLRKLPLNALKMDRSLIQNLRGSTADMAVIRSTIDLAHALGLTVVADGVEDAETLEMLRRLGCDAVQGFLVSRPVPGGDLLAQLAVLGRKSDFPGLAEFGMCRIATSQP